MNINLTNKHCGILKNHPDIRFLVKEEPTHFMVYLYKVVGAEQQIGCVIHISHSTLENTQIIDFMIEETVQKIYEREDEILKRPHEWNPSCRRNPRCLN